jgi:pimeloyl-ACP methyl ester carboxylesterase
MAPAADPPDAKKFPDFAAAIKAAQAAVKARKGSQTADFADLVNGESVDVTTTPAIFLSFHGPDSPIATIRAVKAKLLPKLAVPLLWVAGTRDATQASTRAVFAAAPDDKLSSYVRVEADHAGTPDAAGEAVVAWLKTLG